MSRMIAASLAWSFGLFLFSCPSSPTEQDDAAAADDDEEAFVDDVDACVSGERSRGPSESCCLDFGADACGANLFCAAFDGRTVPTCYVEKTRLDSEECNADLHCASGACAESNVCRASPGQPCARDVGCAAFQGEAYVCVHRNESDRCLPAARTLGGACSDDDGCDSGFCADDRCVSGDDGDSCAANDDCRSGRCFDGSCSSGTDGADCAVDDDCESGHACHDGRCFPRQLGDTCGGDEDCFVVFGGCFDGVCVAQAAGDGCDSDPECGVNGCVDGVCTATCTDSLVCAVSGLFSGEVQECREARCVVVGDVGDACGVDDDCARETRGLTCASGTCRKLDTMLCAESAECASQRCAPVVRDRCVEADGDPRGRCDDIADCGSNQSCLPRALDECVPQQ